jgi:Restriction alleviation protein Lar
MDDDFSQEEIEQMKPCPFCGLQPDLEDHDTIYPNGTGWYTVNGHRGYKWAKEVPQDQWCYSVHCVTTAGGCGAEVSGDSKQEAIDKWNKRV